MIKRVICNSKKIYYKDKFSERKTMISAPSCKEQVLARCADGLIYYAPLYDHVAAWGQARLTTFFQTTQPGAEIPMKLPLTNVMFFMSTRLLSKAKRK